jgi:flagellar biosynthesis protein FliR
MFALVRPFRRDHRFCGLGKPTLVWALVGVGAFFLIPASGAAYFGVAQRIFLAVVLSWAVTVSVRGLETAGTSVPATATV